MTEMKFLVQSDLTDQEIEKICQTSEDPFMDLSNYNFDVCEWGSCQYSSAAMAFYVMVELKKRFGTEKMFKLLFGQEIRYEVIPLTMERFEESLDDFDIKGSLTYYTDELNESEDMLKLSREELIAKVEERIGWGWGFLNAPSLDERIQKFIEYEQKNVENRKSMINRLNRLKDRIPTAAELFEFLANSACDLWSAAPMIEDLFIKRDEIEVPESPGIGPMLNVMVQEQNYEVALSCFLLCESGLIPFEIADQVFNGFDT